MTNSSPPRTPKIQSEVPPLKADDSGCAEVLCWVNNLRYHEDRVPIQLLRPVK